MRTKINPKYCKGCFICIMICPRQVYENGKSLSDSGYPVPQIVHPEACIDFKKGPRDKKQCELCILTCPEHAIDWDYEDN